MVMRIAAAAAISLFATCLTGCASVSTNLQAYADREAPAHSIQSIAALVVAPAPFVLAVQSSLADEGKKQGVVVVDALTILPPTRLYTDPEIKKALAAESIDAVLLFNVGNSVIQSEYAGTFFNGHAQSNSTVVGNSVQTSGTVTATATPITRQFRETDFTARLLDPTNGRVLWVGTGQISAKGRLALADSVSAGSSVQAIFADLKGKKLIGVRQ